MGPVGRSQAAGSPEPAWESGQGSTARMVSSAWLGNGVILIKGQRQAVNLPSWQKRRPAGGQQVPADLKQAFSLSNSRPQLSLPTLDHVTRTGPSHTCRVKKARAHLETVQKRRASRPKTVVFRKALGLSRETQTWRQCPSFPEERGSLCLTC